MRHPACLSLTLLALAGVAALHASEVVVNAQVYNRYFREKAPDGNYQQEFYSFGEGGCWSQALKDPWMERLQFMDVARAVAGPLAKQNFRPALRSSETQVLIMVYWGSTQGSRDIDKNDLVNRSSSAIAAQDRTQSNEAKASSRGLDRPAVDNRTPEGAAYENLLWQLGVNNRQRDALDEQNARILGYTEALDRARFATNSALRNDILEELGGNRYYVVLQAYDFKTAMKEKKLVPLWTTRLSVPEDGSFSDALATMIWTGHRFFGHDTRGMKRERAVAIEAPPVKFAEETRR